MSQAAQQSTLEGGGGKVCVPSAMALWTGGTGNFAFSGADVYGPHSTTSAIRSAVTFPGDFDIHWLWTGGGPEAVIGVMPTSADGSFTTGSSFAGMAGNGWFLANHGSSNEFRGPALGSTIEATVSHNPVGEQMRLSRVGGVLTLYGDEVEIYSWDDIDSPEARIVIAYGNTGSATDWDNFNLCQ